MINLLEFLAILAIISSFISAIILAMDRIISYLLKDEKETYCEECNKRLKKLYEERFIYHDTKYKVVCSECYEKLLKREVKNDNW